MVIFWGAVTIQNVGTVEKYDFQKSQISEKYCKDGILSNLDLSNVNINGMGK